FAQEGPLALWFQRRLGRQRHLCGLGGDFTVAQATTARLMREYAVLRLDLRDRNSPPRSGRSFEPLACTRPQLQSMLHPDLVGAMSAEEGQKAGVVDAVLHVITPDRAELDP